MREMFLTLLVLSAGAWCACSSKTSSSAPPGSGTASVQLALGGADLAGDSVQICGVRGTFAAPVPADPKYRCNSVLLDDDTSCGCFSFNEVGRPQDGTGTPLVISGLCPSTDLPNAQWNFSYLIYSGDTCSGDPLNGEGGSLTCFDARDFLARSNPNQSVDELLVGLNTNRIFCTTVGSAKTWIFESCAVIEGSLEAGSQTALLLDCGCEGAGPGGCNCGGTPISAADLAPDCTFAPDCAINCDGSP